MTMLVRIFRNWLGPDGQYREVRNGLVELSDDWREIYPGMLPRDAEIVQESGDGIPSLSTPAKPGFQAQPENKQIAALVPGGGLSDQIVPQKRADTSPLSEEEQKQKAADNEAFEATLDKKDEDKIASDKEQVALGVAAAHEMADKLAEARGDVAGTTAASSQGKKAPVATPTATKPFIPTKPGEKESGTFKDFSGAGEGNVITSKK